MKKHVKAYKAQIESAELPVSGIEDRDGWAAILFKLEFADVRLVIPNSDPHYCRLLLGYSLSATLRDRELELLRNANLNSSEMRIVKTTVRFDDSDGCLEFSCEFFTDDDFMIRPNLRRYLDILSLASAEFDKCMQPSKEEPKE